MRRRLGVGGSHSGVGGRNTGEKGGGVSGVRLGNDGTLTGCGRLKRGGGVCEQGC